MTNGGFEKMLNKVISDTLNAHRRFNRYQSNDNRPFSFLFFLFAK